MLAKFGRRSVFRQRSKALIRSKRPVIKEHVQKYTRKEHVKKCDASKMRRDEYVYASNKYTFFRQSSGTRLPRTEYLDFMRDAIR